MRAKIRVIGLLLGLSLAPMVGAQTTEDPSTQRISDPLEWPNRFIFGFNRIFDRTLLRPVARLYEALLPAPVQLVIANFYGNLADVPSAINQVLQGKPHDALSDVMRIVINTTIGVGGLFDFASVMGLPKHREEFGRTLAYWGYKNSAYLVLPILGPSTIRDGVGLGVTWFMTVWPYMHSVAARNILLGVDLVKKRAELLPAEQVAQTAAVDDYTFIRDAYLQHRLYINTPVGPELDAAGAEVLLGEPPA